jgi:hypothetical protein
MVLLCSAAFLGAAGAANTETLADRRLAVARMSPADQQELLRKQQRFAALPAEEQERLRRFQAAIDADQHADRLRRVLVNYHEWLKTLSPSQRYALEGMAPARRIEEIKQVMQEQQSRRQRELLTSNDKREVVRWLEDIVWQHRKRLINEMSPEWRKRFLKESEEEQRRRLPYVALRSRRDDPQRERPQVDEQEIERLSKQLSAKARAELASQPNLQAKQKLVGGWISTAMFDRWRSGRGSSRRPSPPPEADLVRFFQEDLPARERDELMSLPSDEARERLLRLYWQRERGESMLRGGPGGPRSDGSRRDGRPPGDERFSPRGGPPRKHPEAPPGPGNPREDRDRLEYDDWGEPIF